MAGAAIARQFGRPGLDRDAVGHVKGEWPYLEKIRDPASLTGSRPSKTR